MIFWKSIKTFKKSIYGIWTFGKPEIEDHSERNDYFVTNDDEFVIF